MSLGLTVMRKSRTSKQLPCFLWACTNNSVRIDPSSRLGLFRMRLRGALDVKHMAIFFRANAYFQIKSNEEMTKPDTPEFEALEKLEMDGYEEAKKLRREILQEVSFQ